MTNDIESPSVYRRIVTAAAGLYVAAVVATYVWWPTQSNGLSMALLGALALIVAVGLSDGFDSIQVGRLISLRRAVAHERESNGQLRQENSELRSSLAQVLVASQTQANTTITHIGAQLSSLPSVTTVEDGDEEDGDSDTMPMEAEQATQVDHPDGLSGVGAPVVRDWAARRRARAGAERVALRKLAKRLGFFHANLIQDVKISGGLDGSDPIGHKPVRFDAYMKDVNYEWFFDVRPASQLHFQYIDRLYVMLSKVRFYAEATGRASGLRLVLIESDDERLAPAVDGARSVSRFLESFQPAIRSGLLRVERVAISEEELDEELADDAEQEGSSSRASGSDLPPLN